MKEQTLQAINDDIYRRFPAVKGKKPRVNLQHISDSRSIGKTPTYLLVYQSQVKLPNNKSLPYWVRVVADPHGKILKISTSR